MSRNKGKRNSKPKADMPEVPDLETFIQKSLVEVIKQRGVAEMGYFETLILEDFAERQWELFKHLGLDTVIEFSTEPEKPWFEGVKADMGGGRFWTNEHLKVILTDFIKQIASGEPFIRKPLFLYWVLHIERNEALKTQLVDAAKAECSDEERHQKFEKISNKMFREGDFRRMTTAEVTWYIDTFKLGAEPEERPIITPAVEVRRVTSAKDVCYNVLVPLEPDPLVLNVVRKAVAYGVDILGNELKIKSHEIKKREDEQLSSARELEATKAEFTKLVSSEANLKHSLEASEKAIHDLKRTIEDKDQNLENLEKQLAKLTKKSSYESLTAERLVVKCLEYARDVKTVEMLADRVLRKENFDDNVVDLKRQEIAQQITQHLNGEQGIHWNETYLQKIAKNRFKNDKRKPAEIVNRLRTLQMQLL